MRIDEQTIDNAHYVFILRSSLQRLQGREISCSKVTLALLHNEIFRAVLDQQNFVPLVS